MRCLIVEDNGDSRHLAAKRLKAAGVECLQAGTLEAAREILRGPGAPIDVILLDLQLPDGDGLSLVAEVREASGPGAPRAPRIVAYTAAAMAGDGPRALKAGCDAYLTKPIDVRALPEALGLGGENVG